MGADPDETKEAIADVASTKDVATKTDLMELKDALTWRMVIVAGIVIAAVGLIVKVL